MFICLYRDFFNIDIQVFPPFSFSLIFFLIDWYVLIYYIFMIIHCQLYTLQIYILLVCCFFIFLCCLLMYGIFKICSGTSLVVQWLRIRLTMQGTQVRALVWEDPTCHGATKPVHHNYWACTLEPVSHNYWARTPRARALQQEKPLQWEAHALQRRAAPNRRN